MTDNDTQTEPVDPACAFDDDDNHDTKPWIDETGRTAETDARGTISDCADLPAVIPHPDEPIPYVLTEDTDISDDIPVDTDTACEHPIGTADDAGGPGTVEITVFPALTR